MIKRTKATAVAAETAKKTARHPANELISAPSGTAATVAPATPRLTTDMARPRCPAGTRWETTASAIDHVPAIEAPSANRATTTSA